MFLMPSRFARLIAVSDEHCARRSELIFWYLVSARKQITSREIVLWMIHSETPKALQASECSELLEPTRANCWITALQQPGKLAPSMLEARRSKSLTCPSLCWSQHAKTKGHLSSDLGIFGVGRVWGNRCGRKSFLIAQW